MYWPIQAAIQDNLEANPQDADETAWQEYAAWQAAVDAGEVEACLLDPSSCPVCCRDDESDHLPF
jgi:hypothetical protein